MPRSNPLSFILAAILIVFTASGCSLLRSRAATPETKNAVVGVASNYLTRIAQGNGRELDGMVVWASYTNPDKDRTKVSFHEQLEKVKDRWAPTEHPLLQLTLEEVEVKDDHAQVVLNKPALKDAGPVRLGLMWVGSGWMIEDDSIFGKDQLLEKLLREGN